jgi:hypothetical protein
MWIYDEQKAAPIKETWVYDEQKPISKSAPAKKTSTEETLIKETWVYNERKSTPEEIRALKWDLLLASRNKDFYDMLIAQGIPADQALDEALSI